MLTVVIVKGQYFSSLPDTGSVEPNKPESTPKNNKTTEHFETIRELTESNISHWDDE